MGGEDVTAAKPDPEGLLLAIGRASGGGKSEVLYVGDSVVDAATAQAAGTDFAGVLHGMTTCEELKLIPTWLSWTTFGGSCPSRFNIFAQYNAPSP